MAKTERGVALISNVAAMLHLVEETMTFGTMGVFSAWYGNGKTRSSGFAGRRNSAVVVEMGESWTRKNLLQAIAHELGIKGLRKTANAADYVRAITDTMMDDERPLIIDEAGLLFKHRMIYLAKEIFDKSQMPVILVGPQNLPQKLRDAEDVADRVGCFVHGEPPCLEDVGHFAEIYAHGVAISPELQRDIFTSSDEIGSYRPIEGQLRAIKAHAQKLGLTEMDRDDWDCAAAASRGRAERPKSVKEIRRARGEIAVEPPMTQRKRKAG